MGSIGKLLLALDPESDVADALSIGISIAERLDAGIHVLTVCPQVREWSRTLADVVSEGELAQHVIEREAQRIRDLAPRYQARVPELTVEAVTGIPFIEIIRRAIALSADVIVQTSRPGDAGHASFTSRDWHLMRKSPVPVWIVRGPQPAPTHVAVAIDALSREPEADDVGRKLLLLSATIADAFRAKLSVYSAWQLEGEGMLRSGAFLRVDTRKIDELLAERAAEASAAHAKLAAWIAPRRSHAAAPISWHVEKVPPRDGIPRFIDRNHVDLAVMGTLGRTGIPGYFIGNTAETVLGRVACSVLTLKPSPFRSPIG